MSPIPRSRNPLFIQELLWIVVESLAEPCSQPNHIGVHIPFATPSPDARHALAALAHTCRTFTEPALDCLWRRLSSLEPLVRCFREPSLLERLYLPPPSQADWIIIRRYAARVRELQVCHDRSAFLLESAIFEGNLFPNLKALKWNARPGTNPIRIPLIQPLLGPQLVVLDFCAYKYDISLLSFLKACPSRCPSLTSARFNVLVGGLWETAQIYSEALCNFKNLKVIAVDSFVNDGALQHLLMSPQFQEVSVRVWPGQLQEFSSSPSDIPLRNVKSLDLSSEDLRLFTGLLRPSNQSFRDIVLNVLCPQCAISIGSLFAGLASSQHAPLLRTLCLRNPHGYPDIQDFEPFILSFDTFRPLTCHTNLRQLIIDLENPVSLDDTELVDLARNWTLLEMIRIYSIPNRLPPQTQAKHMTFKGLLSLVFVCPKLRDVGLTLDGREVPSGDGITAGLGSRTITTLRFPNSPIDGQVRPVARFLLSHFPSVTSVFDECWVQDPLQTGALNIRASVEWELVEGFVLDPSTLESTTVEVDDSGVRDNSVQP